MRLLVVASRRLAGAGIDARLSSIAIAVERALATTASRVEARVRGVSLDAPPPAHITEPGFRHTRPQPPAERRPHPGVPVRGSLATPTTGSSASRPACARSWIAARTTAGPRPASGGRAVGSLRRTGTDGKRGLVTLTETSNLLARMLIC